MRNRKGFTLIEMLVVIAIVAILVSAVVSIVNASATKAKAATDAANLRSIQGISNTFLAEGGVDFSLANLTSWSVASKLYPDSHMCLAYTFPVFVQAIYVDGTPGDSSASYYTIDYLSDVAATGKSNRSTSLPDFPVDNIVWYDISTAK